MPYVKVSRCRKLRHRARRAGGGLMIGAALLTLAATNDLRAQEQTLAAEAQTNLSVTVYQNGLGLIHDDRWVPLVAGRTSLAVAGTNPGMIPESLVLTSEQGGLTLVEQSQMPATLTPQRLLEGALGQNVWLISRNSQTGEDTREKARLLSLAEGPVLQVGDRVEINPPGRIVLQQLPAGLRAEPNLRLVIESRETMNGQITLAYLADGLNWQADYVASLSQDGARLSLLGRVSLSNQSGGDIKQARVQLVAGEVTRGTRGKLPARSARLLKSEVMALASDALPAPTEAAERYVYQLDERVNLSDGERKQLTLIQIDELPVSKRFTFEGLASPQGPDRQGPVAARLSARFTTPDAQAYGKPLPAGVVRVYAPGVDDRALFIGEDRIDHTAGGSEVSLDLGEAFDVTAKARLLKLNRLSQRRYEANREVIVTNAKSEPVEVQISARMPREWKVLEESYPSEEKSARELVWTIKVPANSAATLITRIEAGD